MTVGFAEFYSIKVGERDAGTYSTEDLNARYWQVAIVSPWANDAAGRERSSRARLH